jgi:hypothetical protein
MKKLLILGMAAAFIASACAVHAYPSFLGPTGLYNVPTAYVTCCGELDLAADYIATKKRDVTIQKNFADDIDETLLATVQTKSSWPLRATYGFAKNFEGGFAYDPDAVFGKGVWDVNAKYQIPVNICQNTAFAIGALYGQSGSVNTPFNFVDEEKIIPESHKLTDTQVYLAGTGTFCLQKVPVAVTGGVAWNQFKFVNKNSSAVGFLGVDIGLTKGLDLLGDVSTRQKIDEVTDNKTLWAAGLRYMYCPQWSFEAGVTSGPFVASNASTFFVGVDYSFLFCKH